MTTFTVRMMFRAEDRAAIAAAVLALAEASREEPGCATYIPSWVEGEPATLLIFEQYVDQAAVEAHQQQPHFERYASGLLYQRMLSRGVEHLQVISQLSQ